MIQVFGLITLIVLVFGALFSVGGGALAALPFELFLICGAAFGILIISNAPSVAAEALSGFWRVIAGPKWKQPDYVALLVLLHNLTRRARQEGLVAIEQDIEKPGETAAFQAAPRILETEMARDLICDTFRLMALDLSDSRRAEATMEQRIEAHTDARFRAVSALQMIADALPALGIVAAVIGIIRAMGVIDQSPTIIGGMIAAALLGTFLGVFLAYGIVGPVATRFGQIVEEEEAFFNVIGVVLSAYAAGMSPLAAVELGRAASPNALRPDPDSVLRSIQAARFQATKASRAVKVA